MANPKSSTPPGEPTLSLSLSITDRLVCLRFIPSRASRRKAAEIKPLLDLITLSEAEKGECLGPSGEVILDMVRRITLPRRWAFQLRKGADMLDANGNWPTPVEAALYDAFEQAYRIIAEALDAPAT